MRQLWLALVLLLAVCSSTVLAQSCGVNSVSVRYRVGAASAAEVDENDALVSYSPEFSADATEYTYTLPSLQGDVAVWVQVGVDDPTASIQVGLSSFGEWTLQSATPDAEGDGHTISQKFFVPNAGLLASQCFNVQAIVSGSDGCQRTYTAICQPEQGGGEQSSTGSEEPAPVEPSSTGADVGNGTESSTGPDQAQCDAVSIVISLEGAEEGAPNPFEFFPLFISSSYNYSFNTSLFGDGQPDDGTLDCRVTAQVSGAADTMTVWVDGESQGQLGGDDTLNGRTGVISIRRGRCSDITIVVQGEGDCPARQYWFECEDDDDDDGSASSTAPDQGGAESSTGAEPQPEPPTNCTLGGFEFTEGISVEPAWSADVREYTCSGFEPNATSGLRVWRDLQQPGRRRRLLQLLGSGLRVEFNGQSVDLDDNNNANLVWLEGDNVVRVWAGEECEPVVITCPAPDQGGAESSTGAEESSTGGEEPTPVPIPADQQCQLQSVSLGTGIVFFPDFNSSEVEYWCSCANEVFLGQLSATAYNASAAIRLDVNGDGWDLRSGVESGSFNMTYGINNISVTVRHGCETAYTFECVRPGSAEEQNQTLYAWFQTSFSNCSAVCTNNTGVALGNLTREVYCSDSDGNRADDQFCDAETRPVEWRGCTLPCGTQQLDTDIDLDTDPDGDGNPNDGDGVDIDVDHDGNAAGSVQSSAAVAIATAMAAIVLMA